MGTIINPRGIGGSGKTELARRILADYGWDCRSSYESLRQPGRNRPMGYRLHHPAGGAPLIVLGHYERTSGGCDTIRAADGGLDEVFRLADLWASRGHDVLLEGAAWSAEHVRSAVLAGRHKLHVLVLSTSVEQSARNLIARQRTGSRVRSTVARTLSAQQQLIEAACSNLQLITAVEEHDFDGALSRARELLAIGQTADGSNRPDPLLARFHPSRH